MSTIEQLIECKVLFTARNLLIPILSLAKERDVINENIIGNGKI